MNDPQDTGDALARATDLLRGHTDTGWTRLQPGLLERALGAFRTSEPVRGRHDHGDYFVRTDVLTDQIRRAVDAIPGAAAASITCTTGARDELTGVTMQISAGYGHQLSTLAAQAHAAAHATIVELLGDLAPGVEAVRTHVHIDDVVDER